MPDAEQDAAFPQSKYTCQEVRQAGRLIAGDVFMTDENEESIKRAFLVVNRWRDAHAFPMRSIRQTIISHMVTLRLQGVTAARLKRMQAIRAKLGRESRIDLHKIQDLGGCRVILPKIADVIRLTSHIRKNI